jgi:hypothetical protein
MTVQPKYAVRLSWSRIAAAGLGTPLSWRQQYISRFGNRIPSSQSQNIPLADLTTTSPLPAFSMSAFDK